VLPTPGRALFSFFSQVTMKPLIGITTNRVSTGGTIPLLGASESYLKAVEAAGGLPVLIPLVLSDAELDELLPRLDGVLFPGGGDIDPVLFNGRPHERVYGIDEDRDRVEIHLTRRAVEMDKPFFGICRGIQVINVALGGTLYTDIADQHANSLRHDWYPDIPRETLAHAVKVQPQSRLAGILQGAQVETNSLHHQAVDQPAPSLTTVAWAPDGVIEAVELPGHRFGLGVQWHPENLQAHPAMRQLFQSFIQAAS
jgi:putative glutamine amidotransferase